jgi:DNA-binding NarL/FixJ family response regulator
MKPVITVVIADDHPIFRTGLRQILDADAALRIVAEAGDGDEALAAIASAQPDVAVLDIDMPGPDGLAVSRALRDQRSPTRVILLTLHTDAWFLNAALDAGAQGYVPKESAVTEIIGAIKSVHRGQEYISPVLSRVLIDRNRGAEALVQDMPALDRLTATEMKVLKLVAEIQTTKEIAGALGISPRTVEHHRTSIATKLDLHGAHVLTRFAVKHQSSLRDAASSSGIAPDRPAGRRTRS